MPSVRTRPPSEPAAPAPSRAGIAAATVALLAVLAGGLVLVQNLLAPPNVVEVVVANPTSYEVRVVAGADDGGRLPLATVESGGEVRVTDVVDRGRSWTFVFRTQGRPGAELEMDRSTLESNGWRIEVPGALEARLAELDVAPAP